MDRHNSGVYYFDIGDLLVFDITIEGLENGAVIEKVDVNDEYLPSTDYEISEDGQNVKGYTYITSSQYHYVLDFIDVEVTKNVNYTINEFALYKSKVTSADTIENSNHTLIAAWDTEAYSAEPIEPTEDLIWEIKSGDVTAESLPVEFWLDFAIPNKHLLNYEIKENSMCFYSLENKLLFSINTDTWVVTIADGVSASDNVVYNITDEDRTAIPTLASYKTAQLIFDVEEETEPVITKYKVTFNTDGGSSISVQEVTSGDTVTKPKNPTKSGYTFKEWKKDGATFDFSTPITEDIELKAVWTKNETKPSSGGGGGSSSSSYKVTTKIENGTITPANTSVKKNADQEFTFKVNDGYEITDVLVDGKSVGVVDSYKLEKVTAKHTIEIKTAKVSALSSVDDWAKEEMIKAEEKGLIPETFNGKDATKAITRLDFAAVAVKLYEAISGKKAEPVAVNPFTDTNDEYVLKAYALGITFGTSKTTFTPNAEITREQMATMLTRALNKAGINTEYDITNATRFADDSKLNDWGRSSVYFMAKNEIIKGIGDNRFNGLGNAKVEEAIAIALRSVDKFSRAN